MDSVPTWVLLVCLSALGALIVFGLYVLKDHIHKDVEVHKQVAVHEHVIAKIEGHESRLTKVETQSNINTEEISKMREVRHDILNEVTQRLSSWYVDLRKAIDNIRNGK